MSFTQYSKVRQKAFNLYKKIDGLATKHTKHTWLKSILDRMLRPHIEGLLLTGIPENELKQILVECHDEIEDIADEIKTAKTIMDSRNLNSGAQQKFVESIPEFKEAMELIPDA